MMCLSANYKSVKEDEADLSVQQEKKEKKEASSSDSAYSFSDLWKKTTFNKRL